MEDGVDLELRPQAVQQVAVEDVAGPDLGAAPGQLGVERPDVEGEEFVGARLGELLG